MQTTSKILLLGALTLAVLGAILVLGPISAGAASEGSASVLQQGTGTPSAQKPADSLVQEWDRFCVKKVPYTLLALPENATYEVAEFEGVLPTTEPGSNTPLEFSCTTAGIFRGKQVVVCKGPQLVTFNLKVSSDGASEEFPVGLTFCPLKDPSVYKHK